MLLRDIKLSPLDKYRRLAPGQGLLGVLKPEYRTVSSWGMFYIPHDVEVFKFKDLGQNIGGYFVSSFTNERGTILSLYKGIDIEGRCAQDEQTLAKQVGFDREEIILLMSAL